MFQPRTILHPTDLSASSQYALQIAVDLARQNQGRLVLLHVAPTPGPEQISFAEASSELQPEGYHRRILAEMHAVLDPLVSGVRTEFRVSEGIAATEIDRVAGELRCDLIVIGSRGSHGLASLFFGGVSEHVVRHSPCPVLVARQPSPGR
jgi:nucleotide-binding universal stress UspA family protein